MGSCYFACSIAYTQRPTSYLKYSPTQLAYGQKPNISHLRIFGCAVYVPIFRPQRTKMRPQRRLGIYVGFESPSIIRYLEPLTGDVFTARFADCHFNETNFPTLGGGIKKLENEIAWNVSLLSHLDPRTKKCELEFQKIIHLQSVANQMPDAFTDTKKMTKSYIPAANAPSRIEIPTQKVDTINESTLRQKRGRPMGSKDKNPRKRKVTNSQNDLIDNRNIQKKIMDTTSGKNVEETQVYEDNNEISINYTMTGKRWNRINVVVDNIFEYNVAHNIIHENEDYEPKSVDECCNRKDWPKWKGAIQTELNSLTKHEVFEPIVYTPKGVKPVGFKWVFVRKRNENNEVTRYKARLVAQGFSQRLGIDYEETYSPVVDAITLRYLISLAVCENLDMHLMDVVTAYLYGSLENEIYMKIPKGFKIPESYNSNFRELCSIKLQISLYGLKQSGRMWYNHLSEYLLKEVYQNNPICPCVFIKKSQLGFGIIAVYVDDLNIIGTPKELSKAIEYLKKEFEMKDLGKTKFCLDLQIEHLADGIFIHQSTYTEKILKRFYMDKAHPLNIPMVVRSLDVKKDIFRPREDNEELLGPEVPYLSAIGALMYLANNTRSDIAFSVNLLARYSSSPTKRHWNGVKNVLHAGYLSDPHKARSQTGYLFTCGGTAISWRSVKQTMTATSSNHAEILAIHEASRECVWLRSMTHHIRETCGLSFSKNLPTILFENNTACIAQIKGRYIKGDRTKHISPKLFYTHDLEENGDISVQQISLKDNLGDLFTKALPTSTFEKLVRNIGMRRLRELK
ncbi:hypothetical protein IC582_030288 [Cucumis melo]